MMDALLNAGQRLADALTAENAALHSLDLSGAVPLARAKQQATEAFAAAWTATARTGLSADRAVKSSTVELTRRLQSLTEENRRLLERALAIQAQVIESIAGATLPRAGNGGYGAGGRLHAPRLPPAFALANRA